MRYLITIAVCVFAANARPLRASEEGFFDSGGVRLHYRDEGTGTPVLLVHGYSSDLGWWWDNGVADALIDAGYRVIAYDNRGHGRSDRPGSPDKYGMEMVADARRLLDHRRVKRSHVIGYSMGAAIACKFLERHAGRAMSVTLGGYGRPPLPNRYSAGLVGEIENNLRKMGLAEGNDPEALAHLSVGWSQWELDPEALTKSTTPTLALIGKDDPFLKDTQELAARVPGITVRVLPGDHGSLPAHSAFLKAIVQHLGAHSPREGQ